MMYVGDNFSPTGNVFAVGADGSMSTFVTVGQDQVTGLVTDAPGNLYVGEWPNGNIYKVTPGGAISTFASGLPAIADEAIDNSGNIYVSDAGDGIIRKFTPGGLVSTFATGLPRPAAMAFDGEGNMFVSDDSGGIISKITPSGAVSTFVTLSAHGVGGLAFDQSGNLYASNGSEFDPWVIDKITPGGSVTTFASGLVEPGALLFDPSGNLYASNWPGYTEEITPSGGESRFVGVGGPMALAPVPEPLTMVAIGMGIAVLGGYVRKRVRRQTHERISGTRIPLILAIVMLASALPARATESYAQVDFSSQANFTWASPDAPPGEPVATRLPGAPTGMTTLGGIPFDITSNANGKQAWHADVAANGNSGEFSLSMNVGVYGVTNAYTLINTWEGKPGPSAYASLVFTGSAGATYTKYLVGGVDIRDYNGSFWENNINGTTTVNVFGCNNDNWGENGRLDMQIIALPEAFATQTLTTVQLVDDGDPSFQRTVLDGVTVETSSPVPEPLTMVAVGMGLAGLGGYIRRRRMAAK
jgi:hypothetical protein